jgi:hypothetical protein
MYTVTYTYYNYTPQTKDFNTYIAAKGFLNRVTKSPGVRKAELIIQGEV